MILQRVARGWIEWASQFDVILTPALAQRPLRVGELDACAPDPMETFNASSLFTPFTPFVNVSGQPAISVPCGRTTDGIPVGLQFAARLWDERSALRAARGYELVRGPFPLPPER